MSLHTLKDIIFNGVYCLQMQYIKSASVGIMLTEADSKVNKKNSI